MTKLKLRRASDSDLPLLFRWLKENDLPTEGVEKNLHHFSIGTINDEDIGMGGIEVYGRYGLLRSVVIDRQFRGQHYGKDLCLELIRRARKNGTEELYLLTTTAADFFEKIGFQRIDKDAPPPVIQKTEEFALLCPASVVCMRTDLA